MSDTATANEQWNLMRRGGLLRFILAVILTTAGILTTYHTTIYGLREELNAKADTEAVTAIDSRLIRIETILNERMATKAELQQTRDFLNERLTAISAQLQLMP